MKTIPVNASSSYQVHIGSAAIAALPCAEPGQRVCIVSDLNVWPLMGENTRNALTQKGFQVYHYLIEPGEGSKNIHCFTEILSFLAAHGFQRSDYILALGGGVVGDLAGFCAACYMRGVSYIQVPTTLLAMVDASVGGKTAIDLPAGKNLVGAFWQPKTVLCDTDALATLPPEIFRQGCSEVIKYAILYDEAMFMQLEQQGPAFQREAVIARCVELKAQAVQADEHDFGARRMLNLGHTIGHAIEKLSGYAISHAEAVAMGIAIVTRACARFGYCEQAACHRILKLLKQFDLPTSTAFSAEALHAHALGDKKAAGNAVTLIIPREIGHCQLLPMENQMLFDFIKAGL